MQQDQGGQNPEGLLVIVRSIGLRAETGKILMAQAHEALWNRNSRVAFLLWFER